MVTVLQRLSSAPRWLVRLARAHGGAVAIEAAIIIPLLIIGIATVIDAVRFIGTAARLERVAATAADLTARSDDVIDQVNFNSVGANNELAMFFFSANQAGMPDDIARDGQVIISGILPVGGGYTLLWQRSGPYGLSMASRLNEIPQLPTTGTHIVAEAFLRFRPIVLETLDILSAAELVLYRRAVFRPRRTALASLLPPGG
jgi:hypothetical protein